jgi:hypothetical protein
VLIQSVKTIHKEALSPATDHFTRSVKTSAYLVVAKSFGSEEDNSGALDLGIRERIFPGAPTQLCLFVRR